MCSAGLTCSQNVDENMRWRCRRPALVAVEAPELRAADDEAPLRVRPIAHRIYFRFESAMHAAVEGGYADTVWWCFERAMHAIGRCGPARSPWSRRQVLRSIEADMVKLLQVGGWPGLLRRRRRRSEVGASTRSGSPRPPPAASSDSTLDGFFFVYIE